VQEALSELTEELASNAFQRRESLAASRPMLMPMPVPATAKPPFLKSKIVRWCVERVRWFRDPYVCWRHPAARIAVTFIIIVQDFAIYGEDPVNSSRVTANYPGIGHILGLLTFYVAPSAPLACLRMWFSVISLITGFFLGRVLLVQLFRRQLKFAVFEGCEGAVIVVGACIILCLLINSQIYSAISGDVLSGASLDIFRFTGAQSTPYVFVSKFFQTASGTVDLLTILLVLDVVLQDRIFYPKWAPRAKDVWNGNRGIVRRSAFWIGLVVFLVSVSLFVFVCFEEFRRINIFVIGTSEITRSLMATCIVWTDLFTVMQDWDFPHFDEQLAMDLHLCLPGTLKTRLHLFESISRLGRRCPTRCLPKWFRDLLPEAAWFEVIIHGKWLTYGPLIVVMAIDLFCAKTQLMYQPNMYGQYVDAFDNSIWVIVDPEYLGKAYSPTGWLLDPALVTYAARRNLTTGDPVSESARTDYRLHSKFIGAGYAKYIFFLVCAFMIAFFGVIAHLNQKLEVLNAYIRAIRHRAEEEKKHEELPKAPPLPDAGELETLHNDASELVPNEASVMHKASDPSMAVSSCWSDKEGVVTISCSEDTASRRDDLQAKTQVDRKAPRQSRRSSDFKQRKRALESSSEPSTKTPNGVRLSDSDEAIADPTSVGRKVKKVKAKKKGARVQDASTLSRGTADV